MAASTRPETDREEARFRKHSEPHQLQSFAPRIEIERLPGGIMGRGLRVVEGIKDECLITRGNADASVFNLQKQSRRAFSDTHDHFTFVRRIFDRVLHKAIEGLGKYIRVNRIASPAMYFSAQNS